MKKKTTQLLFIASIFSWLLIACDISGSNTDEETPEEGDESVSLTFERAEDSPVPDSASHAFVRLWNQSTGFQAIEFIEIPDPGERTEVGFSAEEETGYRAGVVAVKQVGSDYNVMLAGGQSDLFEVVEDSTQEVQVDVQPYTLSVERPDTLEPASAVTFNATLKGFSNPFNRYTLFYTLDESETDDLFSFGSAVSGDFSVVDDTTASGEAQFTIPDVNKDTTLFVRHRWLTRTDGSWRTDDRKKPSDVSFPWTRGAVEIPVSADGGNDIIISFSKEGSNTSSGRVK